MDVESIANLIRKRGLAKLAYRFSVADRQIIQNFLYQAMVEDQNDWKNEGWYEAELLRSQLSPRSDNGSRRKKYVEAYLSPIQHFLNAKTHRRILQPGCGLWSNVLRRYPAVEYVGFDKSSLLIDYATRHSPSGFSYQVRDILDFPILGQFDIVLLDYEILNAFRTETAKSIVHWAYSILSPGGLVLGDVRPLSVYLRQKYKVVIVDGRVLWTRQGDLGNGLFGKQVIIMNVCPLSIYWSCQDVIKCHSETEQQYIFSSNIWSDVSIDSISHIPTDKDECSNNIRFRLQR